MSQVWGYALNIGGIGFGLVFVILFVLYFALYLTGKISVKLGSLNHKSGKKTD